MKLAGSSSCANWLNSLKTGQNLSNGKADHTYKEAYKMDPELWEKRKTCLTATDLTTMRGESSWGTEEEIWLTKMGQLDQGPTNLACASGIILEPMIRNLWMAREGVSDLAYVDWDYEKNEPSQNIRIDNAHHLGATPDGCLWYPDPETGTPRIWGEEIKSTSEDWTVLPERVITQCAIGIAVTGYRYWMVKTYHLDKGEATRIVIAKALGHEIQLDMKKLKTWIIKREDVMDRIIDCQELARKWWDTHIIGGLRPDPPPVKEKKPRKKRQVAEEPLLMEEPSAEDFASQI